MKKIKTFWRLYIKNFSIFDKDFIAMLRFNV